MALDISLPLKPATTAAINAIGTAYGTDALRHNLAAYPARIKKQRDAVAQARKTYRDAEQSRAEREAEMILGIATATDEKGKPAFSNAEARAAALTSMKGGKPFTIGACPDGYQYQDALTALQVAENALTEAQDSLQMLLDEYQSARIAARLIAAEMSALSEIIDVSEREEVSVKGALQLEIAGFDDADGAMIYAPKAVSISGKRADNGKRINDQKEAF